MHYFPETHNALSWLYYASLPFLIVIVWLIIKGYSLKKEIIFGVLFFLITISVMLQIFPIGNAIASERYTYIPYIGLSYIAGQWFAFVKTIQLRNLIFIIFPLFIILFSYQTWARIPVWKNTEVICTDIIKNDPYKYECYLFRGYERGYNNNLQGAIDDFDKAIMRNPFLPEIYYYRGLAYKDLNKYESAINDFNKAISIKPDYAEAYYNRGLSKYNLKDFSGTIVDCEKALELNPNNEKAMNIKAKAQLELQKKNN
jgi:tetratricopeptide (TPR) repeat protein